jgi:hypothetical protein
VLKKLLQSKYGIRAIIGAVLVGVLLGSHFYAYRHGISVCRAEASALEAKMQAEARATEKAIRDNAEREAEELYTKVSEYEIYIDSLQNDLRNIPHGLCKPHPDAVRVFNEAIEASGLPTVSD